MFLFPVGVRFMPNLFGMLFFFGITEDNGSGKDGKQHSSNTPPPTPAHPHTPTHTHFLEIHQLSAVNNINTTHPEEDEPFQLQQRADPRQRGGRKPGTMNFRWFAYLITK